MMKKRNEIRMKRNLLAYTEEDEYTLLGVISNISKNGVFIESHKPLPSNKEISFLLAIYNEIYRLKGEIRWSRQGSDIYEGKYPVGLGIRITEAPVEYLNFVEYMKYEKGDRATI